MKTRTMVPSPMVEAQLARIITSSRFRNAPRLSRFLTYVVEECLAGRLDRLKGYSIGLEVFDKPDEFDPQTDTIVRVQARALRQKLEQYYAQDGAQDPVRISISKGSYEPSFAVQHVASTPDGPVPSGKPSIAVLPFDDFSGAPAHASFSDGLTEEVIANLSRFKELSVFSRSTTRKAKLDNLSIPQIHAAFRPDFVLEGSCRINAQTVVITINLVVAALDEVILTEHFKRPLTSAAIYAVQDEIAVLIAARIADRFGPLDQYARRTTREGPSPKWDSFRWVSGYHKHTLQLSSDERAEIKAGLTRAVETDPASADAHAALALVTLDDYRVPMAAKPVRGLLDQALALAQTAVDLDPQNSSAFEALALTRFHSGEFDLFEQAATEALALDPAHGDTLAMIAVCYGARMNWEKAMPLLDQAIALSPRQPGWFHVARAAGLMMTGQIQAAIAEMSVSPLPGIFFYHGHLAWFLAETNDIEGALDEKARLLKAMPDFEQMVAEYCRVWCIDSEIEQRAFAGFERLGLNVNAVPVKRGIVN